MPTPDRSEIEALIARAGLYEHLLRTLTTGIPGLAPKTAETVANFLAIKARLALLKAAEQESAHADR